MCDQEDSYIKQVRQVADEDAVSVRDALSQHLIETREDQEVVASRSSGDKSKDQRQKADRGKEKLH